MPSIVQVQQVVKEVGRRFNGLSGNCARFAVVLNKVLDAGGTYVGIDVDHYEFYDHVCLAYKGRLFDSEGMTTRAAILESLRDEYDEPISDLRARIQSHDDPDQDGLGIRKMVDDNSLFAAKWDEDDLEEALYSSFETLGVDLRPSMGMKP